MTIERAGALSDERAVVQTVWRRLVAAVASEGAFEEQFVDVVIDVAHHRTAKAEPRRHCRRRQRWVARGARVNGLVDVALCVRTRIGVACAPCNTPVRTQKRKSANR